LNRVFRAGGVTAAVFLSALVLASVGCREAGRNADQVGASVSALTAGSAGAQVRVAKSAPADATKAATASPAAAALPLRQSVWVLMKGQASLAQMAKTTDWKTRGQTVYNGLTSMAATSQAGVKTYLSTRNASYKPFWIVNALHVTADQATIDQLAARSDVAQIVADKTFKIPPLQPSTRGITAVEWGLANIRAPEVWSQFGVHGEGIVVANIDTGVQFDHPALVRQYRGNQGNGTFDHNYNWFDPASVCGAPSMAPCDNVAHGTHTMGTMVGDDQNGNQIGVAPGARWIAAKGCESDSCTLDSLLSAGQWVLAPTDLNGLNPRPDLRPHIVNNSWGGASADPFFQATVQAWVAAGMFPAFANGNAGPACGSAGSPGDYPESYAVGAYDINNLIASFSSRGPSGIDGAMKPNISAPGVDVRSSVPGSGYDIFSGTSMATPHLSGSVALIWSAAPSLVGDIAGTRAILDRTAVDTFDPSCGGTPDNNAVYGQGRLDVFQAVSQSPTGPTGTLQGVVTSASGSFIAGALVQAVGPIGRRAVTDAVGAYHLTLPVGTYAVTASAFGFEAQTVTGVVIVADTPTEQSFSLAPVPSFSLSGFVRDSTGVAVPRAQVSISGVPLPPITTDATGRYAFASVPAGSYTITAQPTGGCYGTASSPVTISGDTTLDLQVPLRPDSFGYLCRVTATDYVPATQVLPLSGDDNLLSVPLPFTFNYYGVDYSAVNVTTNGFLNFLPTFPSFGNVGIPNPGDPNAAIFPFWSDLFVDGVAATVRADTIGSAPNRQFVIEWRDVTPLSQPSLPLEFEVLLGEDGSIVMRYQNVGGDPIQAGSLASIGIENETGTVGIQFSIDQPTVSTDLAVEYVLPPSGFVRGTVTDSNDGHVLAGVAIRALRAGVPVLQTVTDTQGTYSLHLAVGPYTIEASTSNYSTATAAVTVPVNVVVRADFALATGRAAISPATIQLTVPINQARTRQLSLSNTGSASMTFAVNESGGGRQTTVSTARLVRAATVDLRAKDTRGLFGVGVTAQGMTPMAAGDIIKSFLPTGLQLAWGIGFTGNLWLSDALALDDFEFTTDGAATGRQFTTPWATSFGADLAFVPDRNLLCQVNGGGPGIFCMDPATGVVVDTITGPFQWDAIPQRGLAYRSDDDTFYIGGWNDGTIYHIAGLSATTPGEVISSCRPGDGNISGLAYNSAAGVLWAATNSPTDTIYELNPDDCTVLSTLAHPQPGFNGAGLEIDEQGNLWMISQNPNRVYLIDSGVPAFSDVPWLSVTPTSGTVAAGTSQSLQVTVDTHGLTPGLYLATLFVQTSAAQQALLRVPVSLLIPDYQQAVNAGGTAYTDSLGDIWPADQKYVVGQWGYVQKSKTVTTTHAISGTPDQTLFKSQRTDPYAYRFDGVPVGSFQVELRFAELAKNERLGQRLFDVVLEDTLVLPAHDIAYEVGTLAAESRVFFVDVTDGHMDLRLIPRAGADLPVINAVRITHRNDR
jgi:hypothetical protein